MVSRLQRPQTKAGKVLLDDLVGGTPDDPSVLTDVDAESRDAILAIETEAAQPYIEALRELLSEVEWWEDSDTPYPIYSEMNVGKWRMARALLKEHSEQEKP